MKHRLKFIVAFTVFASMTSLSSVASTIEGDYLCDGCNGYLTLKKTKDSATYQVWLGIDGGSCSGEVFIKGNFRLSPNNKFYVTWKNKGRKCTTKIEFDNEEASISDTCVTPEDEANSTCAIMGNYVRRN